MEPNGKHTGQKYTAQKHTDQKHTEMMTRGLGHQVSVIGPSGKSSAGTVRIQDWNKKERIRRGLKVLGIAWTVSLLSVLIPLAHFVLVPGFFIAGLIGCWVISGQEKTLLGGESVCPQCGAFLVLVGGRHHWPRPELCSACHTALTVHILSDQEIEQAP